MATRPFHIFLLPPLWLLVAADFAVALFFALSSTVLSHRLILALRARSASSFIRHASSLAFRRFARLYIPAFAIVALLLVAQVAGWLEPERAPTSFPEALSDLAAFLHAFTDLWTWDAGLYGAAWRLDHQLWTVPVEWRGNLVLFAALGAFARCRRGPRRCGLGGLAGWALLRGHWDVALFIAGAGISEVRVGRDAHRLPLLGSFAAPPRRKSVAQWFAATTTLTLAILLASYPFAPPAPGTPLYGPFAPLLARVSSGWRIPHVLGAMLLLLLLDACAALRRPFESRFALYLGRIAYSLYLVHGPLIRTAGRRILHAVWAATPGWAFDARFAAASAALVLLVVWVADLFERAVERAAVRWARALEERCVQDGWDDG